MHREEIKAAVRMTGTTLKDLALTGGLSESACRKALDVPSPRAEQLIARRLKKKLHEVWPERYDADGQRIFTKVNCSCTGAATHGQIAKAT